MNAAHVRAEAAINTRNGFTGDFADFAIGSHLMRMKASAKPSKSSAVKSMRCIEAVTMAAKIAAEGGTWGGVVTMDLHGLGRRIKQPRKLTAPTPCCSRSDSPDYSSPS
jgi:hypothetical protein